MKNVIFLIFVLISTSCDKKDQCQSTNETQAQTSTEKCTPTTPTDPDVVITDPIEPTDPTDDDQTPLVFKAKVTFVNFDKTDEDKVTKALEIIKKVVLSDEFKQRVLNYTYQGQKQFIDNNGMTNEEILEAIFEGREDLLPETDHEMDLELELYYKWLTSTVGYTNPNTLRIWMNTKYFDSYTPVDVAGNVFHEWLHKIGFDHDFNYSESRDHSVPYAIGYLIEELGAQYE